MTINSRQKGARAERELASILRAYGYEARRSVQYCGKTGEAADIVGLPGIHIECKRVERLNINEAMAQAIRDARPGEVPAVFSRRNSMPWLVTISLEDFMTMYGENVIKD